MGGARMMHALGHGGFGTLLLVAGEHGRGDIRLGDGGDQGRAERVRRRVAHGRARRIVHALGQHGGHLLEQIASPELLRKLHEGRARADDREAQLHGRAALANHVLQVLERLLRRRLLNAARAAQRGGKGGARRRAQRHLVGADGLGEQRNRIVAEGDHRSAVRLREVAEQLEDRRLGRHRRRRRSLLLVVHPREQKTDRRVHVLAHAAAVGVAEGGGNEAAQGRRWPQEQRGRELLLEVHLTLLDVGRRSEA